MISEEYIAHISQDNKIQTVREHDESVGKICADIAIPELKSICKAEGRAHDIGKYQNGFQRRIRGENLRIEHSICGSKAALEKYGENPLGFLLALGIAGHHGGIPDFGTFADKKDGVSLNARC